MVGLWFIIWCLERGKIWEKFFFLRLRLRLKEEWLRFLAKTEDCAKLRQMQLFILVWVETFMLQTIILWRSFSKLRKMFLVLAQKNSNNDNNTFSRVLQTFFVTFKFKCISLKIFIMASIDSDEDEKVYINQQHINGNIYSLMS